MVPKGPKIYFLSPISRLRPGVPVFTHSRAFGATDQHLHVPARKVRPQARKHLPGLFSGDRLLPPHGPRTPQPSAQVWCTGSASHGHISSGADRVGGGGSLGLRAASENQF